MLALPDFQLPFTIETDASNLGVGAILMQQGHPIAFLSKGLGLRHHALSTYEELLAIIMAVTKWRPYLQGHHFIIKIDQQSLKYFLEQRVSSLLQQKWLAKLMGMDYEITYKKGTENRAADALSRVILEVGSCNGVTISTPAWLSDIALSYEEDAAAREFMMLATDKDNNGGWTLSHGQLKKDGRIYVGKGENLRQEIIKKMHGSSFAGHLGRDVTTKRINQFFY